MRKGTIATCKGCGEVKKLHALGLCRRCYDNENRDRIRLRAAAWREKNREKLRVQSDIRRYGVAREVIFTRDSWVCQECGMTKEQHIKRWGRLFDVHHKDGNGIYSKKPNNDIKNLITLCHGCHCTIDSKIMMKKRWGKLLEQDDSEWKFPMIRKLIEAYVKKGLGIQAAKREVAKDTGMCYGSIDHRYYEKKNAIVLEGETNG